MTQNHLMGTRVGGFIFWCTPGREQDIGQTLTIHFETALTNDCISEQLIEVTLWLEMPRFLLREHPVATTFLKWTSPGYETDHQTNSSAPDSWA